MANSTKISNKVLFDDTMTQKEKMIYIAIAYSVDKKTNSGYVSYKQLAKIAKCSRATAIVAVKLLVEKKYIIKTQKNDLPMTSTPCNFFTLLF